MDQLDRLVLQNIYSAIQETPGHLDITESKIASIRRVPCNQHNSF